MPPFGLGIKQRFSIGSTFKPTDLSGCVLWLRADKGVTLNGSTVSVWADQSGNGNDFAQATPSQQPTFTASGINGRPSMAVSATSVPSGQSLIGIHAANAIVTTSAAERFFVGQSTAGDPYTGNSLNSVEVRWGSDAGSSAYPYIDGVVYDAFGTDTRKTTGAHSPAGLLASPYIYGSYSQASDWRQFFNGVAGFTTSTNTFSMNARAPNICGAQDAGAWGTGLYSEWIVYNRVVSAPERLQVTRYLGGWYNITVP